MFSDTLQPKVEIILIHILRFLYCIKFNEINIGRSDAQT